MKLFISGVEQEQDFDQAIREGNNIYLEKNGAIIVRYEEVDFKEIGLEGGEFVTLKTPKEEIAELRETLKALKAKLS
ncbi:MAG: hypothetical protein LBR56_03300 [Sporomusaceae bacterium]|jgi:hypothetical protein|nr:hypothetical protein [Sporomusaceae bacterium]